MVDAVVDVPEEDLPADFGKYRLVRRIATGGMAEIFLAHRHDAPLEPLVIKRILPHLVKGGEFVSMFLDEARIAAQLKHDNIVSIDDVGQIDGAYYIAMEYVHGEDIRRIYNRAYKLQRSLPLSHSIRVIADAALGLGYAHKLTDFADRPMGVVHRDVSPQNILVTYEGHVKVVDFGIAKAANKVAQTRAGVLKGKYSYMSPEQALGDPIDYRTDIFALGIILYETTTGTRLFKRHNELATLQAIIKCEFVPPSEALPGYPPELEDILLKALAKDPNERFDDSEYFSEALYDFLYSSGLYVEREVISEFMSDLFQDRLDEEEGSGEPALPQEEEVQEEMKGDATAQMRVSQPKEPTVSERDGREEPAGFTEEGSGERTFGETTPEEDFEDLEEGVSEPQVFDELKDNDTVAGPDRKSTALERSLDEELESTNEGTPADLAPTVAAQPVFQDPAEPTSDEPAETVPPGEHPDEEPPASIIIDRAKTVSPAPLDLPAPVRKADKKSNKKDNKPESKKGDDPKEETFQVRLRQPPASEPTEEELHSVSKVEGRSTFRRFLPLIVAVTAIVLAILAGVIASSVVTKIQQNNKPPPPTRDPVAALMGKITFITEPGATAFADDILLGTASPDGMAGPYEVRAGPHVFRVLNETSGFSRTRKIHVESGQNYQVEIKGRKGWVHVMVHPWAKVSVDGKEKGVTPLGQIPLYEGPHQLILKNDLIKKQHKATIQIKEGQTVKLKVDLEATGQPM